MARKTNKANQPNKAANGWERVYVLGGDPFLCESTLAGILQDLGGPSKRRYGKTDGVATVRNALLAFSFEEIADAILLAHPSADQMKACLDVVESPGMTASAFVVMTPGDTLDARMAFASRASKHKRVLYLEPIEKERRQDLAQHLKDWEEGTGQSFAPEARQWILANAPVCSMKMKGAAGKRETEVYDLLCLENELEKLLSLKAQDPGPITLKDLEEIVHFQQDTDVWEFIRSAVSGQAEALLTLLGKMAQSQNAQGALWLLASQLEFLLGVKTLRERGFDGAERIASEMARNPYLGRYLGEDWQERESVPDPPAVNVWRVRKALEQPRGGLDRLSRQYQSVLSALQDLRAGLDEQVVFPFLALALADQHPYARPFRSLAS